MNKLTEKSAQDFVFGLSERMLKRFSSELNLEHLQGLIAERMQIVIEQDLEKQLSHFGVDDLRALFQATESIIAKSKENEKPAPVKKKKRNTSKNAMH